VKKNKDFTAANSIIAVKYCSLCPGKSCDITELLQAPSSPAASSISGLTEKVSMHVCSTYTHFILIW